MPVLLQTVQNGTNLKEACLKSDLESFIWRILNYFGVELKFLRCSPPLFPACGFEISCAVVSITWSIRKCTKLTSRHLSSSFRSQRDIHGESFLLRPGAGQHSCRVSRAVHVALLGWVCFFCVMLAHAKTASL